MIIKTLLVDDEPISLKNLESLITSFAPALDVIGKAKSEEDALEAIFSLKPDLVFLDIELGGSTGFDILQKCSQRDFEVIFVTAHNEFGIEAVKAHAFDYILKPVNKTELLMAIDRVVKQIQQKRPTELPLSAGKSKISLSTMEGILFVDAEEVLYAESEGRYTRFHLNNGIKQLVSKNIGEYELLLEAKGFVRIHNSYLVNLHYVQKYIRGRGGYVVLKNGQTLEVSTRKKDDLLDSFQ